MHIHACFGRRRFTTLKATVEHLLMTSEPKLCKKDNVQAQIANMNYARLQTRF
jgi:hypothetical protein